MTVWIYPNSDPGYKKILKIVERNRQNPNLKFQNVDRDVYLTLLAAARR